MRTISLVNRLKWTFSGNMNPHALVLGDVDNDGDMEFVIGNLNGKLSIFKGECPSSTPAYDCDGLGTITCIAIGDVRNTGKNSIVVINAEGHCHVFDITPNIITHAQRQMETEEYIRHSRRPSESNSIKGLKRMISHATDDQHTIDDNVKINTINLQQPTLTLKVPVNVNKMLIADIDGDGLNELILARTDRILHSFQLENRHTSSKGDMSPINSLSTNSSPSPSTLTSTIQSSLSALSGSKLGNKTSSDGKESKSNVLRKGMVWKSSRSTKDNGSNNKDTKTETIDTSQKLLDDMYLKDKDMWVFDGQITSLATTTFPDRPNEPILLVAQPGNTFTIIDQKGNRFNRDFTPQNVPYVFGQKGRRNRSSQNNNDKSTTTEDSDNNEDNNSNDNADTNTIKNNDIIKDQKYQTMTKEKTRTIRTLLHRQSILNDIKVEDIIVAKEDEDNSNSNSNSNSNENENSLTGVERTNYIIQDWPIMDDDDIIGDDKNGAVATEIVIGKRHSIQDQQKVGNEVGMLSMDGKFIIYDLRTKKVSQQDLFVTHKLFSLATLNVSGTAVLPRSLYPAMNTPLYFAGSSTHHQQQQQQQQQQSQHQHHLLHLQQPLLSQKHSIRTPSISSPALSASSKLSRTVSNNNNNSGLDDSNKSFIQPPSSLATIGTYIVNTHQDNNSNNNNNNNNNNNSNQELPTTESGFSFYESENQSIMSKSVQGTSYHGNHTPSNHSRRQSHSSFNTNSSWGDVDDNDDEEEVPDCDLFVACAWNGVTYLIDWSKRVDNDNDDEEAISNSSCISEKTDTSNIRFQLVKFAFEGRVCAFTAGLYAVAPGYNVPCLFYVDFEDQIFVYYDVRITPGPVTGFIDVIDDDVEEALDRLMDVENGINKVNKTLSSMDQNNHIHKVNTDDDEEEEKEGDNAQDYMEHSYSGDDNDDEDEGDDSFNCQERIDLGDGWKGIMDQSTIDALNSVNLSDGQLELSEFIHECLYEFDDLKEQLESDLFNLEQQYSSRSLTTNADIRRLSNLNIAIEPDVENELAEIIPADMEGLFPYDQDIRSRSSTESEVLRNWMDENLLNTHMQL